MATVSPTRLVNIDALKREIADGVSLSQVAEHLGIDLQASGDQWRGLCPIHDENTPSFYINDGKGVYHCFGCKAGGDMIDLAERVRNLDFIEALYWLAAEADVEIANYERPLTDEEREREAFRDWAEGWLASRSGERLPDRVDAVGALFGVVQRREGPSAPYLDDKRYLMDGVILPWRLPSGQLVGWRVREHPGAEKRVIGTPNDFPLGKINEQTLFGIQIAREHISQGRLYLVEGEYDCMALHSHGVRDVAAMGGSTLTNGQIDLLMKLRVREVVLVFDGDDGGRAAARSAAEKLWAHETILFRVTTCADGMDPEDVLHNLGDWAFLTTANTAPTALEFLLRLEWSAQDRGDLSSKLGFVKWIRDTYGSKLRGTELSLIVSEVAKWLQIPEIEVRDFVRAAGADALNATDSERVLLGKACRDSGFYVWLRGQLVRDDFFVMKHQRVWDMLAQMLIDGQTFDAITVTERARSFGIPDGYIDGLLALPDGNLEWHKQQVADLSLRRSARDDALAFKDQIADLNQPADILVGDLTHKVTSKALRHTGATQRQLTEQVDEAMETLHERMANPDDVHGLNMGMQFPKLTRTLQGLQRKRLVLISAVSGVGKSTMALQWAAALGVHQSVPVDLISLEMDETEMLFKIAAHMTNIDSMKITGGALEPDEAKAVEYAMMRIRNSPLHIWAPDGMTGTEFLLYAREAVMQRRTQAFFVDYVQLIDPEPGQERDNGYKLYGDFGRLVKMKVARAMDVSVICCAQLNRGASAKERPTKEDMGDSYALVRHSDVIVILHRDGDSNTLDFWIDKNRQGPPNVLIPMVFQAQTSTFYEASGSVKLPEYLVTG